VSATLDRVWRESAASMRATLARRLGDLDLAEEALGDAVARAAAVLPQEGTPDEVEALGSGWALTGCFTRLVASFCVYWVGMARPVRPFAARWRSRRTPPNGICCSALADAAGPLRMLQLGATIDDFAELLPFAEVGPDLVIAGP
jgi:hypothetical protein